MKKIKVILTLSLALTIFGLNYKLYANESTSSQTEHSIAYEEKYEKEKRQSIKKLNLKENYDIPQEVKDDLNALSNITYLKPKTDSNYEVALAYENGDYIYLDSAATIEEAIEIAKSKVKGNVIPAVINKDGLVIYATDAIGRIVNCGEQGYGTDINPIKIYRNPTNDYDLASIYHGFVDDVPITQDNGKRVKIQVNGLTGWIDKEDKKGVNIIAVPINQAKNLSYFTKSNKGSLNHYISSDVENSYKGNTITIGIAPSFMQSGKKYYSYDCKYFYNDINDLLTDLQNESYNNAVNKDDPYYNYYTYISTRHKSSYSVEEINNYIKNNTPENSVLRNKGKAIVDAQNKYGVNANLILAIAMNESMRGTSNIAFTKNNIFGLYVYANDTSKGNTFESIEACIGNFAKEWMNAQFLNPKFWKYNGSSLGNKVVGINVRYADDPFWGEKAAYYIYEMDRYISGEKSLIEYNRHKIGIYKLRDTVKDINGKSLYDIVKDRYSDGKRCAQIGEPVIILSQLNNKVKMYPDRQVPISEKNPEIYNWNFNGYVNSQSVEPINNKEERLREFTNFTVNNVNVNSSSIIGKGVYDANVRAYVAGKKIENSVVINTTENFKVNIPHQKLGTKIVVEISKNGYKSLQKTIVVRSDEKPVISAKDVTIKVGDKFDSKKGVSASDKEDGNLTSKIVVVGNVNTSKVGTYTIKYEVSDKDGNKATKQIKVTVLNTFKTFELNSVESTSTSISGKGLKGASVKAYVDGKQIGTTKVDSKGAYKISIPKQKAGKKVVVKMSKSGYATTGKNITVNKN